MFNDKKENYYIFNIYNSDDDLRSFFSMFCYTILCKTKKNTTYKIDCTDTNSISSLNEQDKLICSISFDTVDCIKRLVPNYGGASAYIYAQLPTIFLNFDSYLSSNVSKKTVYRLEYNGQLIKNVNNDEKLQQLLSLANKYTLTELYYYIDALTYYINKVNQFPSKDDILNAMRKAKTALQEKTITDLQAYKEQDEEDLKSDSNSAINNIRIATTMKKRTTKNNLLSNSYTHFSNIDRPKNYQEYVLLI